MKFLLQTTFLFAQNNVNYMSSESFIFPGKDGVTLYCRTGIHTEKERLKTDQIYKRVF